MSWQCVDLPGDISERVAHFVFWPSARLVAKSWSHIIFKGLELHWAMLWRDRFGDGDLAEFHHRTTLEMRAFYDTRTYLFRFLRNGTYSACWAWQVGINFAADTEVSGRWHVERSDLVLARSPAVSGIGPTDAQNLNRSWQGDAGANETEANGGQDGVAGAVDGIPPFSEGFRLPLEEVLQGRTSSSSAAPWEAGVRRAGEIGPPGPLAWRACSSPSRPQSIRTPRAAGYPATNPLTAIAPASHATAAGLREGRAREVEASSTPESGRTSPGPDDNAGASRNPD